MSIMIVDGYQARIEYDPDLDQFRGEILGLNGGIAIRGSSTCASRPSFMSGWLLLPRPRARASIW